MRSIELSAMSETKGFNVHSNPRHPVNRNNKPRWKEWNMLVLDTWLWEVVSMVFSSLCFIAIFGILLAYDQKESPIFPQGLLLNAIVSILSTGSKSSLIIVIGKCIGQLKWIWFHDENKRPLNDLQSFDSASRGPLGSLTMGIQDRGRSLISVEALITILVLAFDPFMQQVLSYPVRQVPNPSSIATAQQSVFPFYINNVSVIDHNCGNALTICRNLFHLVWFNSHLPVWELYLAGIDNPLLVLAHAILEFLSPEINADLPPHPENVLGIDRVTQCIITVCSRTYNRSLCWSFICLDFCYRIWGIVWAHHQSSSISHIPALLEAWPWVTGRIYGWPAFEAGPDIIDALVFNYTHYANYDELADWSVGGDNVMTVKERRLTDLGLEEVLRNVAASLTNHELKSKEAHQVHGTVYNAQYRGIRSRRDPTGPKYSLR